MVKIEIGRKGDQLAILKVFNELGGFYTTDGLEGYKSLGEPFDVQDGSGIKQGPVENEYLNQLLENQENHIRKIMEKIKA